jgi:hypothetical protein
MSFTFRESRFEPDFLHPPLPDSAPIWLAARAGTVDADDSWYTVMVTGPLPDGMHQIHITESRMDVTELPLFVLRTPDRTGAARDMQSCLERLGPVFDAAEPLIDLDVRWRDRSLTRDERWALQDFAFSPLRGQVSEAAVRYRDEFRRAAEAGADRLYKPSAPVSSPRNRPPGPHRDRPHRRR